MWSHIPQIKTDINLYIMAWMMKPPFVLDDDTKQRIRNEKKNLSSNEILIKHRLSKDSIKKIEKSRWELIGAKLQNDFWDRVDDKV